MGSNFAFHGSTMKKAGMNSVLSFCQQFGAREYLQGCTRSPLPVSFAGREMPNLGC
jgi:hypothetical protein